MEPNPSPLPQPISVNHNYHSNITSSANSSRKSSTSNNRQKRAPQANANNKRGAQLKANCDDATEDSDSEQKHSDLLLQQQQLLMEYQMEMQEQKQDHPYNSCVDDDMCSGSQPPTPAMLAGTDDSDYNEDFSNLVDPDTKKTNKSYSKQPSTVPINKLSDLTVSELKGECKKRNLPVSGPKPNLLERLKNVEDVIVSERQEQQRNPIKPEPSVEQQPTSNQQDINFGHCNSVNNYQNNSQPINSHANDGLSFTLPPVESVIQEYLQQQNQQHVQNTLQSMPLSSQDHLQAEHHGYNMCANGNTAEYASSDTSGFASNYSSPGVDISSLNFGAANNQPCNPQQGIQQTRLHNPPIINTCNPNANTLVHNTQQMLVPSFSFAAQSSGGQFTLTNSQPSDTSSCSEVIVAPQPPPVTQSADMRPLVDEFGYDCLQQPAQPSLIKNSNAFAGQIQVQNTPQTWPSSHTMPRDNNSQNSPFDGHHLHSQIANQPSLPNTQLIRQQVVAQRQRIIIEVPSVTAVTQQAPVVTPSKRPTLVIPQQQQPQPPPPNVQQQQQQHSNSTNTNTNKSSGMSVLQRTAQMLISGNLANVTVNAHEQMLKHQQQKIEVLQKELQKSQDHLKHQQQVILAAKKIQNRINHETDAEETSVTSTSLKQTTSASDDNKLSVSKNTSSAKKTDNSKNAANQWLTSIDTKQLQKLHIQLFLHYKLQQQQFQQQMQTNDGLIDTQSRLREELAVQQAITELVRVLKQDARQAIQLVQLLRKHRNGDSDVAVQALLQPPVLQQAVFETNLSSTGSGSCAKCDCGNNKLVDNESVIRAAESAVSNVIDSVVQKRPVQRSTSHGAARVRPAKRPAIDKSQPSSPEKASRPQLQANMDEIFKTVIADVLKSEQQEKMSNQPMQSEKQSNEQMSTDDIREYLPDYDPLKVNTEPLGVNCGLAAEPRSCAPIGSVNTCSSDSAIGSVRQCSETGDNAHISGQEEFDELLEMLRRDHDNQSNAHGAPQAQFDASTVYGKGVLDELLGEDWGSLPSEYLPSSHQVQQENERESDNSHVVNFGVSQNTEHNHATWDQTIDRDTFSFLNAANQPDFDVNAPDGNLDWLEQLALPSPTNFSRDQSSVKHQQISNFDQNLASSCLNQPNVHRMPASLNPVLAQTAGDF